MLNTKIQPYLATVPYHSTGLGDNDFVHKDYKPVGQGGGRLPNLTLEPYPTETTQLDSKPSVLPHDSVVGEGMPKPTCRSADAYHTKTANARQQKKSHAAFEMSYTSSFSWTDMRPCSPTPRGISGQGKSLLIIYRSSRGDQRHGFEPRLYFKSSD